MNEPCQTRAIKRPLLGAFKVARQVKKPRDSLSLLGQEKNEEFSTPIDPNLNAVTHAISQSIVNTTPYPDKFSRPMPNTTPYIEQVSLNTSLETINIPIRNTTRTQTTMHEAVDRVPSRPVLKALCLPIKLEFNPQKVTIQKYRERTIPNEFVD